jgi:hypothetical protein
VSAAEQDASTGPRAVELVERVGRGDPSAEEEVADAYRRRILLMMLSRTRERAVAEDLTQEALIAVLGALRNGQVEPGVPLGPLTRLLSGRGSQRVRGFPKPRPQRARLPRAGWRA